MKRPHISVLLTVWNGARTLVECIESILCQSEPDFELVVVDDGSTDETPGLIAAFCARDERVIPMDFSGNRGIVAALNRGLQACRGSWIARMDADDRMAPNRLELQKQYAARYPEVDLWGARVRFFRDVGHPSPGQLLFQNWINDLLTDQAMKAELFLESPIIHPTFFVRQRVYRELDGYRDEPWAEDYDFLFRAAQSGVVFGKVPHVLLEKRDSPTRLYRVDPRCKRQAMLRAKAHYFLRSPGRGERAIVVAGTGSSGRGVARALKAEGVPPVAFVDNMDGPPGRTVMGLPTFRWDGDGLDCLQTAGHTDPFFLLCIGNRHGRIALEQRLQVRGLLPGTHYSRFL